MSTTSSKDYEDFVEKFKLKKTTDDCYTPDDVYSVVKRHVIDKYFCGRHENTRVLRPFYPGGDYIHEVYPENSVVIDNPPFSIISEIIRFYVSNRIKFFLFAPHLTLFSPTVSEYTRIVVGASITYTNGAVVETSFVTNLDRYAITSDSRLKHDLACLSNPKRQLPKYQYPDNLLTVSRLKKLADAGADFEIPFSDVRQIGSLDAQKTERRGIFGNGFLCSNMVSDWIIQLERKYPGRDVREWVLSDREVEIIERLG